MDSQGIYFYPTLPPKELGDADTKGSVKLIHSRRLQFYPDSFNAGCINYYSRDCTKGEIDYVNSGNVCAVEKGMFYLLERQTL